VIGEKPEMKEEKEEEAKHEHNAFEKRCLLQYSVS